MRNLASLCKYAFQVSDCLRFLIQWQCAHTCMVPGRRAVSDKCIPMFPIAPKSPAKRWSGMVHFGPRVTESLYSPRLRCEPPGFGPGTGRPVAIIADIRKLLTFDLIKKRSKTAQKRLHKTIKKRCSWQEALCTGVFSNHRRFHGQPAWCWTARAPCASPRLPMAN